MILPQMRLSMNCLPSATPAAIGKAYLLSGLLSDFSGNAQQHPLSSSHFSLTTTNKFIVVFDIARSLSKVFKSLVVSSLPNIASSFFD